MTIVTIRTPFFCVYMETDRQKLIYELSIPLRVVLQLMKKNQNNYEKYLLFAKLKKHLPLRVSFSDVELSRFGLFEGIKIRLDVIDGCEMLDSHFLFSVRGKILYIIDYNKPDLVLHFLQPAFYYLLLPYSYYFYKYRYLFSQHTIVLYRLWKKD